MLTPLFNRRHTKITFQGTFVHNIDLVNVLELILACVIVGVLSIQNNLLRRVVGWCGPVKRC